MDKYIEIESGKSKEFLNMTKVMKYFPECYFAQLNEFDDEIFTMPIHLCPTKVIDIVQGINHTMNSKIEFYRLSQFCIYDEDMEKALDFLMLLDRDIYRKQERKDYSYEIDFMLSYTYELNKEYDKYLWSKEKEKEKEAGKYNFETYDFFNRQTMFYSSNGYFRCFLDFVREKYNRPDLLLTDTCSISEVYIQPNFNLKFYTYYGCDTFQHNIRHVTARRYNFNDMETGCSLNMKIIFIKLIK